ncbi:MAG: hypothetical protein QXJ06_00500 [Candidatus Aenigmatarchaeota archaeon]
MKEIKILNKKYEILVNIKLDEPTKGGKNNYLVYKGKHIPNKSFKSWRDKISFLMLTQCFHKNINDNNLLWLFLIYSKNKKRKDITSILDALFHCLEYSNIIKDDAIIQKAIIKYKQKANKDYFRIIALKPVLGSGNTL